MPWKNNFYENLLKNYSEEEIRLTGLYYKSDKTGKYVDRFNSRILFPINNITGDTIAFGGRIFKENKFAKYINSPETEFYKKGNMIFNLDKAKDLRSKTDEVLIVEGYMDVVSVYSAGIKNVISNSGTALTERQISLIWKFFSSPIICLDGDESGQNAAYRIAEKLFSLINEKNKIYFSIMPDGKDPDDFIKERGKDNLTNFLKEKEIIQSFIWNYHLQKIDQNNPYEISKFEKDIKKLSYTIKDETIKKYVLEDFLEKINKLTPIQNSKESYQFNAFRKKKNYRILKETKILHQKNKALSKIQIIEISILFLVINYLNIAAKKLEELSEIIFETKECEDLKSIITKQISEGKEKLEISDEIKKKYQNIINLINDNSNMQLITKNKSEQDLIDTLHDLIQNHKEENSLKKIEFLERKLVNNLDENSYTELIKLKSQLNRG